MCLWKFQYQLKEERFNIKFCCKQACKMPKYVLKESKSVILIVQSFWDHMADIDPGAYLPKWSLYAPGLIEMAYFDSG